ncbi:MAG: flagellar hook-associated protein FlgK [Hyphomicrobiaceae bacterium]|nr:MAG: flagellar hook-associated protein FlgK [Hyphomicrobiaceae bacterium]
MTLSLSLDVALSGLSATADQTSVVSRNIANAGVAGASRKIANIVTAQGGGVRIVSITRVSNAALFANVLGATSDASAQKALVSALDQLDTTNGDPENDVSPAAFVQKLADALQQYAAAPHDTIRARSAVAAAGNLADALNRATQTVQQVRQQADAGMADSATRLNTLLSQFETLNNRIVEGTRAGADVTDYLDQRDQLLAGISEEVGIRAVSRDNNDMAIYTDSGVTLFDVRARGVTFERTQFFDAGTVGNAVYADGVPITGNSGTMTTASGRLAGLAAIRDSLTTAYQSQLDEIARTLVTAFAESDQSATPSLPDVPGLFTYPGAPAIPASATVSVGLAGTIRVNPSVDPDQGGDAALLRDGGISGNPAYVYNTTGAAGYSDRLNELIAGFSVQYSYDPAAQGAPSGTLADFASSSVAWLQEARKSAQEEADYKDTLLERSSEALSKETGVNLDEEMTNLLELERSYQASAKLISTIDGMFNVLLAAVVPGR